MPFRTILCSALCAISLSSLRAQSSDPATDWSLHFQQTIVAQYHFDFPAAYTGSRSLKTSEPAQTSVTATFFVGRRLWRGGELFVNPELSGGNGLSNTSGVAGFPNGETFRIGNPEPAVTLARCYVKQRFNFSTNFNAVEDGENQIAGTIADQYCSVAVGKFSIIDFFDKNIYGADPRSQFLNWGLMANGAWDYPANTRGYTWGIVGECAVRPWTIRAAVTLVPTVANGSEFDMNIARAQSTTLELQREYLLAGRPGTIKVLSYFTQAHMGNYAAALSESSIEPDITATRTYGRTKYGLCLNLEQSLANGVGLMLRAGWSDGRNETWAFTEIDRTISGALSLGGELWHRDGDQAGLAILVDGLSHDHAAYLAAGGEGFIIGDGALNYAPETIAELYYAIPIPSYHLSVAADYQFILNPAYNADRGPVHAVAARVHLAI